MAEGFDALLTTRAAAERLGRPMRTLQDWRYRGIGPKFARIEGRVAYRQSDLDEWVNSKFATSSGEPAA